MGPGDGEQSPFDCVLRLSLDFAAGAAQTLRGMVERPVVLRGVGVDEIPLARLGVGLAEHAGPSYCVHLSMLGDVPGDVLLVYDERAATAVSAALLGELAEEPTEDLVASVLQETGNLLGCAFLNMAAETSGLEIEPSPPEVRRDYLEAVLQGIELRHAAEADRIPVVRVGLEIGDGGERMLFFVILTRAGFDALGKALLGRRSAGADAGP